MPCAMALLQNPRCLQGSSPTTTYPRLHVKSFSPIAFVTGSARSQARHRAADAKAWACCRPLLCSGLYSKLAYSISIHGSWQCLRVQNRLPVKPREASLQCALSQWQGVLGTTTCHLL